MIFPSYVLCRVVCNQATVSRKETWEGREGGREGRSWGLSFLHLRGLEIEMECTGSSAGAQVSIKAVTTGYV
jgi:hypothetical protein